MEKGKEKSKVSEDSEPLENDLSKQLEKAVQDLYYMSETDAEIAPFIGKQATVVSTTEILAQTGSATDLPVEEKGFSEFFSTLTEIQDWFGDEEKQTAQKFAQLKKLLEDNLRDLKVFKLGKIQLDVYVVGLDAGNTLSGVKTKAVET